MQPHEIFDVFGKQQRMLRQREKKALRNSVRTGGWLVKGGTQPVVKMDGLSPYKSNGIFDRRWAGECRPQSGDEKE